MSKINEGQTQVYMNGMVTPQVGVDTSAAYLNTPPQQLMDLAYEFFKSGKSESQVLAILVGMGTPQQLAYSAIQHYKMETMQNNPTVAENTNQKNNSTMNFTLTGLYEMVVKTLDSLKEMSSDNSRVSFSVKAATEILENVTRQFPVKFNSLGVDGLTEEVEATVNPSLKFMIAKNIHNQISAYNWIDPVLELKGFIEECYNERKWAFRIAESVSNMTRKDGMYAKLGEEMGALLNESEQVIFSKMPLISYSNPWSPEAKKLVAEMKEAKKESTPQSGATPYRLFTPMITEGESMIFRLHGKDYKMTDGSIEETKVTDNRYNVIAMTLAEANHSGDSIVFFGDNGKSLEFNINEGTIMLGNMDISNHSSIEIQEALIATKFYGFRDQWKINNLCTLFENIGMVTEMDNFLNLTSEQFLHVYLTMLSLPIGSGLHEGVYVNKVNHSMGLNEMKYFESATEALNEAKEFIGYDATTYLSEKLQKENNEKAIVEAKRSKINEEIDFLEEKRKEIEDAMSRIGEDESLKEALELISTEIAKKEKELSGTYTTEKIKNINQYLNDGYVEATVAKNIPGLRKGEAILVNAEEYSSLGDEDLIDTIIVKSGNTKMVKRGDLEISLSK